MFTIMDGVALRHLELANDEAPPNVKKGENAWDAQDKIFRHIEDHLRQHLENTANGALEFVKKERIDGIIIGGHRPLFGKVDKHLKYPLAGKVIAQFVTELKIPQNEIIAKVLILIDELEKKNSEEELQQALSK